LLHRRAKNRGFVHNPLVLLATRSQFLRSERSGELRGCDIIINTINYTHDDLPTRTRFHHWPSPVRGRSDSCSQPDASPPTTREGSETEGICSAHFFAARRSSAVFVDPANPRPHTLARGRQRLAKADGLGKADTLEGSE